MATITSFNFLSLNGFYKGSRDDISWHHHGPEELQYSVDQMRLGNALLLGRCTYQLMQSVWTSPQSIEIMEEIAKGMNNAEKIVVSRTLSGVDWNNSRLLEGELIQEVTDLKRESGKNITILGSGSIVAQLAEEKLIDIFELLVDPVALPSGTHLFSSIERKIELRLISALQLNSGKMLLKYGRG